MSKNEALAPVGVFDSGVGGLSVLIELRRQLPAEQFVYFADSGRCPYGSRPIPEIEALTQEGVAFLRAQGAKAIVVACNTASAAGLGSLRVRHEPAVPVIGLVPALKPAVALTRSKQVAVLATPATLGGSLLADVIAQWAAPAGVTVHRVAAPGLVEAVEAGALDAPETRAILHRALDGPLAAGVDALVLGCTHFRFGRAQIAALAGPGLAMLDSGAGVARQTARRLQEAGLCYPATENPQPAPRNPQFYTSGDPAAVARVMSRLLGEPVLCESWQ
jgi:glutamate racemase